MTTPNGGSDPNQGWSQGPPPSSEPGQPGMPPPPPPPPGGEYSPPTYGQPTGQPYGAPSPGGGTLAGFWIRFLGALIDGILLGVITLILRLIIGDLVGGLLGAALSAGYFIYLHGTRGQTLGQSVVSLKVVDETTGGPIDFSRAGIRWVVASFSVIAQVLLPVSIAGIIGLAQLLGYLWMLWDPKNQTWHDKAAKTVVLKV